ncbi:TPA: hypothetical protein HA234_01795 [Candidatus Woesearchaeota archaeon]|nr:hypothetical protein [Candidatus Woesearchaeota archaeon]
MEKNIIKSDSITFDEFIDLITENRGEEIKKQIKEIELNSKKKKIVPNL